MAISSDLMMAIFAMDSYNRDYNEGISVAGTAIGTATVGASSSIFGTSNNIRVDEGISFFAQSYTWNGKTVISYRGTDAPGSDALYGWGLGLGFPEVAQAEMMARRNRHCHPGR